MAIKKSTTIRVLNFLADGFTSSDDPGGGKYTPQTASTICFYSATKLIALIKSVVSLIPKRKINDQEIIETSIKVNKPVTGGNKTDKHIEYLKFIE